MSGPELDLTKLTAIANAAGCDVVIEFQPRFDPDLTTPDTCRPGYLLADGFAGK